MQPFDRPGNIPQVQLAVAIISLMTSESDWGSPWPPHFSGYESPCHPPSTNCLYLRVTRAQTWCVCVKYLLLCTNVSENVCTYEIVTYTRIDGQRYANQPLTPTAPPPTNNERGMGRKGPCATAFGANMMTRAMTTGPDKTVLAKRCQNGARNVLQLHTSAAGANQIARACVCVRVRVCARARARLCVRTCVRACVCVCVCPCGMCAYCEGYGDGTGRTLP
jgi:hypothetical protein